MHSAEQLSAALLEMAKKVKPATMLRGRWRANTWRQRVYSRVRSSPEQGRTEAPKRPDDPKSVQWRALHGVAMS